MSHLIFVANCKVRYSLPLHRGFHCVDISFSDLSYRDILLMRNAFQYCLNGFVVLYARSSRTLCVPTSQAIVFVGWSEC